MLFKTHLCRQCQNEYDIALDECPRCHCNNEEFSDVIKQKNLFWIPYSRQIALFLIGALGFQIFGFIVSLLISIYAANHFEINSEEYQTFIESTKVNAILQLASYLLLSIALVLVITPFFKKLYSQFASVKALIKGISYGLLGLGLSSIYGLILSQFYQTSGNANQSSIETVVNAFPLASLLLFGFIGPFCEELTYRSGLFNFALRINKAVAYTITIVIFAIIHFDFQSFANTDSLINELLNLPSYAIGAAVLCYAYDRDGLGCSTYAHITNNVFSVVIIIVQGIIQI